MVAFVAVVLIAVMFMIVWNGSTTYNDFTGVIVVAAIFTVFYFCTPFFIRYVPLKKYHQRDYEREEFEYEYEPLPDEDDVDASNDFTFNREVFEKIKEKRQSTILNYNNLENSDNIESTKIADKDYIPIIKDVTEAHASSPDMPLKKMNPSVNLDDYDSYDDSAYYDNYNNYDNYGNYENYENYDNYESDDNYYNSGNYDDYDYSNYDETENFDDGYPTRPDRRDDDRPDGSRYTANRKF